MSVKTGYVDDVGCCREPSAAWWQMGLGKIERYCLKCGTSLYVISTINEIHHHTGRAQEVLA